MRDSDVDRRRFLQVVTATGAVSVAGLDLESCTAKKVVRKGVKPSSWHLSVCPYCGVGCGLRVGVAKDRVVVVEALEDHPVNRGRICLLGRTLVETLRTADRLTHPQQREGRRFRRVSWADAEARVAQGIGDVIRRHGPDAFAMYVSASEYLEEYYVYNKFVKGCLGTNNLESSARLCWASGVVGLVKAFGADAPPCAYDDVELADLFVVSGYNLAASKPVFFRRLIEAKARRKTPLIVVDPRRTTTAGRADLHLALRPGSDVALHNALAHLLISRRLIDEAEARQLTANFDALKAHVASYPAERAAKITGLPTAQIVRAAEMIGRAKAGLFLWGQGLNQSSIGTRKVTTFLNLVFITGNVGKPGAGPLAITGQTSAMGLREVGALPHLLPGFRQVTDAGHRNEVARIWGVEAKRMSPRKGLPLPKLLEAVDAGKVGALWVVHANPAATFPDSDWARRVLGKLELLVVQDCYHPTETSELAHVLLPGATWSEKGGTMTNSERGLNLVEAAVRPPGQARPDLDIVINVARRMGFGAHCSYGNTEAIFEEYKRCTKGRVCDIDGVTYARLRKDKGIQWPVPTAAHRGTKRRFLDRKFPKGKVMLGVHEHQEPAEKPDRAYPLVLLTGLSPMQFHSRTRTAKVAALTRALPEPLLEIHPDDARRTGVATGGQAWVTSRRGRIKARVKVTSDTRRGMVFLPYHFGYQAGKDRAVNRLTHRAFDEFAGQPEFKAAAVKVEPA